MINQDIEITCVDKYSICISMTKPFRNSKLSLYIDDIHYVRKWTSSKETQIITINGLLSGKYLFRYEVDGEKKELIFEFDDGRIIA